jgi:hypothetical protein
MRFLSRLPNPWPHCVHAVLPLPRHNRSHGSLSQCKVEAPGAKALQPHAPATAVVPHCRRRRKPHRDTSYVANIYFKCFRNMLQVFHLDVAKLDRDVTHVAMATYICFKCMFQMCHMYVASVSFGCCKTRSGCCINMQVFQVFSYVCCKCFIWMLQN